MLVRELPQYDLIVIGGGAAGLWAAGTAAQRSRKVLVLEKNNKPGVKILMSGGTRCNITQHCGVAGILDAFGSQSRFLKPAVYGLPPDKVVAEFNGLGVATKVEHTGKVFPVSDRAIDVRDALVRRLTDAGAELRSGVAVTNVSKLDKDAGENALWRVCVEGAELTSAKVLLCCGGLSYAGCGTTGDGYAWAKALGHTILATFPALTPLVSSTLWIRDLQGVTLPDAEARVVIDGRRSKDPRTVSRGGLLWTHFGVSGPVPMNVSRYVASLDKATRAILEVDLVPEVSEAEVTARLNASSDGRRAVGSSVQQLVPKSVAAVLLARAGIEAGVTLAELPKRARQSLAHDLKRLQVPLSGTRGYPKAEVTQGGICTQEVNPKTLESRLVPGLYLAGEILDIDGPIGGYNFQAAFSTGHLAGLNV